MICDRLLYLNKDINSTFGYISLHNDLIELLMYFCFSFHIVAAHIDTSKCIFFPFTFINFYFNFKSCIQIHFKISTSEAL